MSAESPPGTATTPPGTTTPTATTSTSTSGPGPGPGQLAGTTRPATGAPTREDGAPPPPPGLWALLREDWNRHYRSFAHPGLHALAVYRVGRWRLSRNRVLRTLVTIPYKVINNLVIRNLYGVEISDLAVIGRRVLIGHHQTILIPKHCVIGDDCTLRHNLTIGYAGGDAAPDAVARIGDRVELAPGVHLIGGITIGDDARIGPASVVMSDVPAGATVFSAPARIMRRAGG